MLALLKDVVVPELAQYFKAKLSTGQVPTEDEIDAAIELIYQRILSRGAELEAQIYADHPELKKV